MPDTLNNLDEQLMAAEKLKEERARNNDPSGSEGGPEEQKSLREMVMEKRRTEEAKNNAASGIEEGLGMSRTTSGLLRTAWELLIPSFGLSLIYINIHVFLGAVLGENFFCKLGDEWIPKIAGENIPQPGKMIGLLEKMGLLFLDLLALTIIFSILALIVMIVTWISASWLQKIKWLWDALSSLGWSTISALVNLFK